MKKLYTISLAWMILFMLYAQHSTAQVTCVQVLYVSLDLNGQYTVFPEDLVAAGDISPYTAVATPANLTCDDLGPNVVTLELYQGEDLIFSCATTVVVEDKVNPTAVCQSNPSVVLDINGQYMLTAEDIDLSSYDNCGIESVNIFPSVITCSSHNPFPVTAYFTDASGNTGICTTSVSWEENPTMAQALACNDNVVVEILPGQELTVTPEMILEGGPYGCYFDYFAVLNVNGNDLPEPVLTQADSNSTIIVTIVNFTTGVMCWGTMSVLAPSGCEDPFNICDTECHSAPTGDCNSGHATFDHVEWPCDIDIDVTCEEDFTHLTPAYLQEFKEVDAEDAEPQLINVGCNLIGVTYDDQVFSTPGSEHILRTWSIVNWVTQEIWSYPQTINVDMEGGSICDILPHTAPVGDCASGHTLSDNVEWPADITVNTVFISPEDLGQNPDVAAADAAPQIDDPCEQFLLTYQDIYLQLNSTTLQVERQWQIFNTFNQQISLYTQFITITGYTGQSQVCVTRESGEPIPGVELIPGTITDQNGCVSFADPDGIVVTPVKDAPLADGINLLDQVAMLEHLLNINPLSRFLKKAADLSQDNLVTTVDYAALTAIMAGNFTPTFDHNWMFFEQNSMAQSMDISNPMMPYHFIGVKMGDLDNSYVIQAAPELPVIRMNITDEILNKKEEYQIPFMLESSNRVVGFTVKINNPSNVIDFREVTAPLLPGFSMENNVQVGDDYILVQWVAPDGYIMSGVPVSLNDPLFTIRLSPAVNSILSEQLTLDATFDNLLKPNNDPTGREIKMNWEDLISSSVVALGDGRQIEFYPNPVQDRIFLKGIHEMESGQVFVFDPVGRMLTTAQLSSSISVESLLPGVYYIVFQTADARSTAVPFIKQ